MLLPAASLAAQINDFGEGLKEVVAFPAPYAPATVNLTIPAECHVRKVALNITTASYDPSSPLYPESVRALFNDSLLYEFNGTGFGAFGRQEYFSDGTREFPGRFATSGGQNATTVRVPKRAVVDNATFELAGAGGAKIVELLNLTNSGTYSTFGYSAAGAGDLDGDGTADFVVGDQSFSGTQTYSGRATVFFGGPDLSKARILNITGSNQYGYFGCSVGSAGDVNGDGFDDLIVGEYGYSKGTSYYVGAAHIFFGGRPMDSDPDVSFIGTMTYGELGMSVAGAGDVNGDGYDDVLVGEPYNSTSGQYRGTAYAYFGGKVMDAVPDLVFEGVDNNEYFGASVAGAGDVNGDGRPDIIIGAMGASPGGTGSGEARIYFGGPGLDNQTDVYLPGAWAGAYFGGEVASAGDVNGDGFGDVIVGAYLNSSLGTYTGAAYLFLGAKAMDSVPDLSLSGESGMDYFGFSVAGGFDINSDGYDDIAVGAPYRGDTATYAGRAYVYFGGQSMNVSPDAILERGTSYEQMGMTIAGAGDINGDGHEELLVGAPGWIGMGDGGRVIIYSTLDGVLDPKLEVASKAAFGLTGYINRTFATPDLSKYINDYLPQQFPSGWDSFGNTYCDVPLNISGRSEGSVSLRLLNLTYSLSLALPDFSDALNAWIPAHRKEADQSGNLKIPVRLESSTPGRVRLTDLSIVIDESPRLLGPIPDASLDEDSFRNDLIDLGGFFEDDFDSSEQLAFSLVSSTFPEMVAVSIINGRYVSADALSGDQNDNWTGTVEAVVRAEDHWGSGRSSNVFRILVRNVNDPPVITSQPPTDAYGDVEWVYRVLADDGDRDRLTFRLDTGPAGMAVNASTGVMTWIPQKWGRYQVAVSVSDESSVEWQKFTLTVPNRPPAITSLPKTDAFIGQAYSYAVAANDPDGDALSYTLGTGLEGFLIDRATGLVTGTPFILGDQELVVGVSDGKAELFQRFTLKVVWPNRSPYVTTNALAPAQEGMPYSYEIRGYDSDKDPIEFVLAAGPSWLAIDKSSGLLRGTPELAGNYSLMIKVQDGRGGEGRQELSLRVADSVAPTLTLDSPAGKVRGAVRLAGNVVRGSREVLRIEVRLNGGEWREARFNSSWNLTVDTGKLRDGEHSVQVRAYDGWEYSPTVSGILDVDNSKDIQTGAIGPGAGLLIAVAIAAAAAAAAAVVLLRRRKG